MVRVYLLCHPFHSVLSVFVARGMLQTPVLGFSQWCLLIVVSWSSCELIDLLVRRPKSRMTYME